MQLALVLHSGRPPNSQSTGTRQKPFDPPMPMRRVARLGNNNTPQISQVWERTILHFNTKCKWRSVRLSVVALQTKRARRPVFVSLSLCIYIYKKKKTTTTVRDDVRPVCSVVVFAHAHSHGFGRGTTGSEN